MDDDLVIASGAAGEGVPGAGARDGRHEVAVEGPSAVGADSVAEARRVGAAAEQDAVLHTSRALDYSWAAGY